MALFPEGGMICAVRHFETEKNVLGVHGRSGLDRLTGHGHQQAAEVAWAISELKTVRRVTCFPTPQSLTSADALCRLLDVDYVGPLDLAAYDLGVADGLSHDDLCRHSPESALSLDLFRNRVIDGQRIRLEGAEGIVSLQRRLVAWWNNGGESACVNSVVIGSNSTLLMLTNLLQGWLPDTGRYMCFGIPNGALRTWRCSQGRWQTVPPLEGPSWPETECRVVTTRYGKVQTTLYHPGWADADHVCLIAPGYFENSRLGPFGLFARLAHSLAFYGLQCITMDYLGSGESTCIQRSFEMDYFSLESVFSQLCGNSRVSVIAHSLGAALVARLCARYDSVDGYALSPLCTVEALSEGFLSPDRYRVLLETGTTTCRGIVLGLAYVNAAEREWTENAQSLRGVILAEEDPYDKSRSALHHLPRVPVYRIAHADHTFSSGNSSQSLISQMIQLLVGRERCVRK
jgi:broad specificity phosphatase PhoE